MFKKIWAAMLSLALVVGLFPVAAHAEADAGSVNLAAGTVLTTQANRVWIDAGYYVIQSAVGSKVLEIAGASKKNGANARVWQPRGTASQIFAIENNGATGTSYLKLKASGKVVGTTGGIDGNVQQSAKTGGAHQQWIFEDAGNGWVYIRNLYGYYLDVAGGTDANGQNVQVWSFNGGSAQRWKLVRVSGGVSKKMSEGSYLVQPASGARVLDVSGASVDNGANLQLWDRNESSAQIFTLAWNSSALGYHVRNASGKLVSTLGNTNGVANVHQWEQGNGVNGDNWLFESAGGGWYYIRNLWGYYLDVANGADANGTNVQVYSFNGSAAQKWKVIAKNPPAISGAIVSGLSAKTYTGKAIKPNPKVVYNGKKLTKGVDYKLSYKNNKAIGKATVTIKGIGFYTGSTKRTFAIKMPKPKVTVKRLVKNSYEYALVKWSFGKTKVPNSQINGFKIQVSVRGSSATQVLGKKTKMYKNRSCSVGCAQSKALYKIRILAYKKVGKKTYSTWSKTITYRSR